MRRRLLLLFCTAVLSAPAARAELCILSADDRRSVGELAVRYRDAWFAPNPKVAVMALFAQDATILPHHGVEPRVGHAQIREFWFPPSSASFQLLSFAMERVDVAGCGPVAYVWGRQAVSWKTKGAPEVTSNAGTFLMVARRDSGRWLIERLMWDDPPNRTT
jgi:uncharacterized protein (TIGR02246 family)